MNDIDDHTMERIRAAMINAAGIAMNRDRLRAALQAADLVPAQRLRDAEARAERLEFAWVIEHENSEPCDPVYWTGLQIMAWSPDHEQAIRFARQCDAETMANGYIKRHPTRVAEHGWEASTPPTAPTDDERTLPESIRALPDRMRDNYFAVLAGDERSDIRWPLYWANRLEQAVREAEADDHE